MVRPHCSPLLTLRWSECLLASADDFASPGAYVPGGGGGMSVPDVSYDDDDDGDIIE